MERDDELRVGHSILVLLTLLALPMVWFVLEIVRLPLRARLAIQNWLRDGT